jgi:hypothetical protein
MKEYPKALYGPTGWDNVSHHVIVYTPEGEKEARARGFDDMAKVEAKKKRSSK